MFKSWRKGREGGAKRPAHTHGLLGRIARNKSGNVLALVGAALIPLLAMIGTGVDLSRAYMAKARLQAACDAGSLAGRRVMTEDVMNTQVRTEAIRYFNFNFPQQMDSSLGRVVGPYQTAAVTPTVTRPGNGTVAMTASTTIPTTIMRMFGFSTLPLSVSCQASLNFVNTEIMLVLDVTGSMASASGSTTRIQALRDAVMALYDELKPTQDQLEANGLRLRYGIVPYSQTVNVGALVSQQNVDFLTPTTTYNSRVANFNTAVYVPTDTPIPSTTTETGLLVQPGIQRYRSGGVDGLISNTNCGNFGNNNTFTQSPYPAFVQTGNVGNDNDIYVITDTGVVQNNAPANSTGIAYVRYQFSRNTAAWTTGTANRVCDRNVTVTRRTYERRWAFTDWTYQRSNFDTSVFRTFSAATPPAQPISVPVTIASNTSGSIPDLPVAQRSINVQRIPSMVSNVTTYPGSGTPATTTQSWNGCIEERQTVNNITTSADLTIPEDAFDLNINLVPNATDIRTQWRPMWPQIVYSRADGPGATTAAASSYGTGTCPAAARRLAIWNRQSLLDYVNALVPTGSTYHDIGMLWGARLLSPTGPFGDGCEVFNGMTCSRHIIFMTDGDMDTDNNIYQAYGIERNDGRVSGQYSASETERNNRHLQRFRMICNAARGTNASVWVIAFAGTTVSTDMRNCASNANQASTAANRDALIARFRQIGNQIGALRLTQ